LLSPLQPTEEFTSACTAQGIEFEPGDVERLGAYLSLLLETNKSFNLTAVTDPAHAWMRHIFDSLTLLAILAELPEGGDGSPVIDVGSGGGLPGLPLAICLPRIKFTLLEATGKKADFLKRAAAELSLANVTVVAERAEHAGQGSLRESFDVAVARAVGPLSVIAELTVPLVKIGGQVLLIKGQKAPEELAEAKKALHMLHVVHAGTVETPTGRIVVLDKPRKTPAAYPRRDGEPKRDPL
jgi:16S rRNA (guanine527-N7)-methyltransferase